MYDGQQYVPVDDLYADVQPPEYMVNSVYTTESQSLALMAKARPDPNDQVALRFDDEQMAASHQSN